MSTALPRAPPSEHGWPSDLCRWHSHREYELHLIAATRGKAFVGDYIGEFGPGLFLTGPIFRTTATDEVLSQEVPVRDMLVQFDGRRRQADRGLSGSRN